ncbi:hypothetical protein GC098_34840 [Paenibacillus sp. LMG 31458]|uniref:Integron-associated effector binding protein domain-containing protein n=1 Tax=Paenibacillus phytorum TaxID=2654977 RepID=A0ABX1Y7T4_9BACL|nr:hypothetical protein [Paenibacillus phytorum]NOU76479.1 hypothetical protein [Paenibacillus phytorum]
MPYVLQHKISQQIFTCTLVNHYGLAYYGVKFWPDLEEAEQEYPAFLHNMGGMESDAWQVTELEEGEMKLCNVKLKNDPNLQVFWPLTRKPEVRKLEK